MFDFMSDVNDDDTLQAARYAMRTMIQVSPQGGAKQVMIGPDEFSRRQINLGKKIVAAIEADAGEPVTRFDRAKVDHYAGLVYKLADEDLPPDPEADAEAMRVLELFRNNSPAGSARTISKGPARPKTPLRRHTA